MRFLRARLLASCLYVLVASSCAPLPPPVSPRPFVDVADQSEYAPFFATANAQLVGQAFLTTRGGDVKLAAGRVVTLDPATRYAREWFRRFGADASAFGAMPADSLFRAARRTTTANAEGRFRFSSLAPGEYLARTTVTWEAAGSGLQGGVVAALVTVTGATSEEAILNTVYLPTTSGTLGISIVAEDSAAVRDHREIGISRGTSCQVGLIDAAPAESAAREDLIVSAARLGADAVTKVTCKRFGMSLRPNCTARIACEGLALSWM